MVNPPLGQALAGLSSDQATTVRIRGVDALATPQITREAQARTGYVCRSWQETNAASVDAFDRQDRITLVLVAAFGVANVLVRLVAEKRRDIAILRAAGFERSAIVGIYLLEGALLGLGVATFGWIFGAVMIRVVAAIPVDFGESAALRDEHLQMADEPWFYIAALVVSLLVCTIAAAGPTRRAARLEPTAILRGER